MVNICEAVSSFWWRVAARGGRWREISSGRDASATRPPLTPVATPSRPYLSDFREVCALLILSRIYGMHLFLVILALLGLLESEWFNYNNPY